MSSIIDSGCAAKQAEEIRKTPCPKSKNGKHNWEDRGSWPSTWGECKNCKATYYDK